METIKELKEKNKILRSGLHRILSRARKGNTVVDIYNKQTAQEALDEEGRTFLRYHSNHDVEDD